ncbi:MAG: O-antigen ligase family protein, partial [Planctomycetota bacterium]
FVGAASVYEARMGANPFDFWRSRWAGPVPWDGALYRAGIRRVAGPFAHPICHGFFFSMAVPIGCWLVKDKLAAGRVSKLCVVGALILGLLASVSRGPMMGLAIALLITLFGWSRNRTLFLVVGGLAGLFALALAYPAVQSYLTVDRGEAVTATQETAAYRNEMLQNYLEVVRERPWLGFGKDEIPIVKGQKSIDNQYLFLALTHGLPAAVVFLGLMVVPIVAALCQLLQRRRSTPIERLRWVLTGVLAGAVFTQVTVFSGTQTTQVLLLLEGLTVGLLGSVSQRYPGVLRGSI